MLVLISGNNKKQRSSNNIVLLRSPFTFLSQWIVSKGKGKGERAQGIKALRKITLFIVVQFAIIFPFLNAHLLLAFVNWWSFDRNLCNTSIKADDVYVYLPLPEMCSPRHCARCRTDHEGRNECVSHGIYSDSWVARLLNWLASDC